MIGFEQYNFSKYLAEDILNFINKDSRSLWRQSLIAKEKNPNKIRTSSEMLLKFLPKELQQQVNETIHQYKNKYNEKYKHAHLNKIEQISILKYQLGNYFKEHSDHGWGAYRTTSIIVYLNPSKYEGGETYFPFFDLFVKPKTPSIIFFPSNYIYAHSALPVVSGEKIVMVTWANDLPDQVSLKIIEK